jgi:amino acid adenylation domain-containing protein
MGAIESFRPPGAPRLPENIEAIYPLTSMQKAMLFHAVAAPPESAMYFQQLTWVIRGGLDGALFREAWDRVVHRHAALRTFFLWEGRDEPAQCVCRRVQTAWIEKDWRNAEGPGLGLPALLATDRRRGFRLNEAPLARFHLLRMGEEAFQFVWSFHHTIMDGWCLPIVTTEAFAIYRHLKDGAPLTLEEPVPYWAFVAWSLRQERASARESWRRKLAGFSSVTSLRLSRPAGAVIESDALHTEWVRLSPRLTARLRAAARSVRCTLSTLVQAAWALLLRAYSGEGDVVFGVTIACRPQSLPGADRIVGLLINTLPARVRARGSDRLPILLADLMAQQIERDELCSSSLAEVQAVSETPPGTPLFESILVFENYPIDTALNRPGDPLAIHDFSCYDRTNYPLTLLVNPGERLEIKLTGDPERFDREAVARLSHHLATLLEAIAANPDGRVADFALNPPEDLRAIRETNRTRVNWDLTTPLHVRIEAQAAATPDAIALLAPQRSGVEEVTYRDLDRRASQAARLLRARGIGPDEPVGICMDRSVEMVVGLLAILKADGAYVPFDPAYPAERLRFMVEDIRPRVVLTQSRLLDLWQGAFCEVIALDAPSTARGRQLEGSPPRLSTADHLAYVMYTSGSTGQPKGAMNTHRGVVNRLLWMQQAYPLEPDDRILQKTPFSFDVSVWEFFWPLMVGAQLVIAEPGGHLDPDYLIRVIREEAVTTLHFVPSMLRAFLDTPGVERCDSLRRVICSGEALPLDLEKRFFERLGAQLHNLYGPTEAAVDVTAWACKPDLARSSVPIGRPIANTEIHLLDRDLRLAPLGARGELCIGGLNVGRGYWRRPALTAEKFIPDPFSDRLGARLYRTGDLARRTADGAFEYLDRQDHQVKIRGFRIELGEIEARVADAPGIRECAVVTAGDGAEKRLIAYVSTADSAPSTGDLSSFLRRQLPEYMIPSTFVLLPRLPLSANGKVDRRALPRPEAGPTGRVADVAMPQSEAERSIAGAWREVLRNDNVGLYDNFFELGGNSLLLLPVQHRLQRLFKRPIPLTALFRAPTVRLLAEFLTAEPEAAAPEQSAADDTRGNRMTQTVRLRGVRSRHRAAGR